MPMVTSAVASAIERSRLADRAGRRGEPTVLVAALLLPMAMVSGVIDGLPLRPLTLLALLALLVRADWAMPW